MQCILFNKQTKTTYRLNNFITLSNIHHASANRTLKGPVLGPADKYTTLLPLTWPIKPFFHFRIFRKELFVYVITDCQRRCIQNPVKNLGWRFLLNVANYNYV